jgi:hypothetical protein
MAGFMDISHDLESNRKVKVVPFTGNSALTSCHSVDVGQTAVDAVVIKAETLVIEAEKMQHGGVQVVGVGRVFGGLKPKFVGTAVSRAAANAAPNEPDGKRSGIIVPAFTLTHVG